MKKLQFFHHDDHCHTEERPILALVGAHFDKLLLVFLYVFSSIFVVVTVVVVSLLMVTYNFSNDKIIEAITLAFVGAIGNFTGALLTLLTGSRMFSRMSETDSKDKNDGGGGPKNMPEILVPAATVDAAKAIAHANKPDEELEKKEEEKQDEKKRK